MLVNCSACHIPNFLVLVLTLVQLLSQWCFRCQTQIRLLFHYFQCTLSGQISASGESGTMGPGVPNCYWAWRPCTALHWALLWCILLCCYLQYSTSVENCVRQCSALVRHNRKGQRGQWSQNETLEPVAPRKLR